MSTVLVPLNVSSTTSNNDPHLEELTIIIAMDNTELLITNLHRKTLHLTQDDSQQFQPSVHHF